MIRRTLLLALGGCLAALGASAESSVTLRCTYNDRAEVLRISRQKVVSNGEEIASADQISIDNQFIKFRQAFKTPTDTPTRVTTIELMTGFMLVETTIGGRTSTNSARCEQVK